MRFGILDDDSDGRAPDMLHELSAMGARVEAIVHATAPEFLSWLHSSIHSVRLLSLDHDLGPGPVGTGMDVVDYLVKQKPSCPVIVHSSNPLDAPTMVRRLAESEWDVHRIRPLGDDWIEREWIDLVKELLSA